MDSRLEPAPSPPRYVGLPRLGSYVMASPVLEDIDIAAVLAAVVEPVHPLNGEEDPQTADFPLFQRPCEILRFWHLHRARIERRRPVLQRDDQRVVAHLAAD